MTFRHQFHQLVPCGVCSKNTKEEVVEILVFKRSARFFAFTSDGDDFKNKEQINELEVCIAIRI